MRAVNVCLVAPLPPPYGGIAHWSGLITRYASLRQDVNLDVIDIAPRWRSVHDLSLPKRVFGGAVQMIRDLFSLLQVVRKAKIDVIHLTTSGHLAVFRDVGVLVLSRFLHIPLVYHIRFGRVPQVLKGRAWEGRLIAKVLRDAEVVLAIDEATEKSIRRLIPEANVKVVPNCVDYSSLPVVENFSKSVKVALFVGWVIAAKGIAELLSAWSRINPDGWVLRIVGPADAEYVNKLRTFFPSDSVEFLGELSHPAAMKQMALCDLFVLPSYTEGFPNAVVEAMALGRAVVSTRVGAIPEMLDQGQCGVLVEPRDENALADAIQRMLIDDAGRVELGRRAAARASANYSIDSVFDRYLSIWGSLSVRTPRI